MAFRCFSKGFQAQFLVEKSVDLCRSEGPMFLPPLAAIAAIGTAEAVKVFLEAKAEVNPKLQGGSKKEQKRDKEKKQLSNHILILI